MIRNVNYKNLGENMYSKKKLAVEPKRYSVNKSFLPLGSLLSVFLHTHTHTHTHIYIYIYIYDGVAWPLNFMSVHVVDRSQMVSKLWVLTMKYGS